MSLNPFHCYSRRPRAPFFIVLIITPILVMRKAFSLQSFSTNPEAQKEAYECDASKNAKSQDFPFRLDLDCNRKQSAREKGPNGATGCR